MRRGRGALGACAAVAALALPWPAAGQSAAARLRRGFVMDLAAVAAQSEGAGCQSEKTRATRLQAAILRNALDQRQMNSEYAAQLRRESRRAYDTETTRIASLGQRQSCSTLAQRVRRIAERVGISRIPD